MNILMIAPEPFLASRGTPISVCHRLRGLAALGHSVDLLTYHLGQDVDIPGVKIHRIARVPFIHEVKIGPSMIKVLLDILIIWKAVRMLIKKRYDVIHTHEEAAFIALILSPIFRTRHLYDMHSSLPQQLGNFSYGRYRPLVRLFEMLERWTVRTCDGVITISANLEQRVRAINSEANVLLIENVPDQTAWTNGNGLSVLELKKTLGLNSSLPIVYTGSLERYQGVDLLIESADFVRKQYSDVKFVLVGGRPEQVAYWRNEVQKKSLDDCVQFVGVVPTDEASVYLDLAEILVSARTQGTQVPLKIYSYLLAGKPIVATDVFAHTEVLTKDIAVLVEPTPKAFGHGICELIQSPQLRRHLGLRAQKYAEENYRWEDYVAKVDRIYKTLQPAAYAAKESAGTPKG
jgi:glycosyltransferase involved in cell wall biosynthesis